MGTPAHTPAQTPHKHRTNTAQTPHKQHAYVRYYKSKTNRDINTKLTECNNELWPSMLLKAGIYISISTGIKGGPTYPLPHENMWISLLLIELQSSPKHQKNPHDQLIWGVNTFQSFIYHRFSLKPGFVFFFLNTPSLWISRLLIELWSSSKTKIILRTYLCRAGTLSKA